MLGELAQGSEVSRRRRETEVDTDTVGRGQALRECVEDPAGRVAAIVGSHTHVPTADARVLPGGSGFITDVGMCGPYNSIIGREVRSTLRQMTTGMYVPAEVGSGDEAVCGVILKVDEARRRCLEIERVEYRVDRTEPPFV